VLGSVAGVSAVRLQVRLQHHEGRDGLPPMPTQAIAQGKIEARALCA